MTINDAKLKALKDAGYTGSVDDAYRSFFLAQLNRSSGAIPDLERDWLGGLGFTGSLQDRWNAYLNSLSYTGALPEKQRAYWERRGFASLGDRLWLDVNANGLQDVGEPGIGGRTIRLYDGGADKVLGTADDVTTRTTTTGANGIYLFTGLTPGVEYQVSFIKPGNSVFSPPNQGADDSIDSDANPATARSHIVTLSSGEVNLTVDAGVYARASLGDRIWLDTNGNGLQDAGESGITGLTVRLLDGGADRVLGTADDITTRTLTTGADGLYLFTGLTPGVQYQVQFSKPAGTTYTTSNVGLDDAIDSDADPATGRSQVVSLTSGETNSTVDAGVSFPEA